MSNLPVLLSLIDELSHETPAAYQPAYYAGYPRYLVPQRKQQQQQHQQLHPQIATYALPLSLLAELANYQQAASLERERKRNDKASQNNSSAIGKDGFQVCMDVAQFKPNELTVKVVDNNNVVVEGKHEEREDENGYIARHFVRRYVLPAGYEADQLVSTLSSDGVLTIRVPKPQPIADKGKERIVQIQQTGPAHLNVKANAQDKAGEPESAK